MYLIGIILNSNELDHHLLDNLDKNLKKNISNNSLICIFFIKNFQDKLKYTSIINKYSWIYDITTYEGIIADNFHESELIKHLTLYTYSPNNQLQFNNALPMA